MRNDRLRTIFRRNSPRLGLLAVTVGFWLWFGGTQTALADWAAFATSYLAVVALEPVLTWALVNGLKKVQDNVIVQNLFVVHELSTVRTK